MKEENKIPRTKDRAKKRNGKDISKITKNYQLGSGAREYLAEGDT
jgi:hypothetical protein